jgi:hypothetical protein
MICLKDFSFNIWLLLDLLVILTKIKQNIMKKFALTTKLGEIITKVICDSMDEAIELFSMKKHINSEDLLEIFDVKELS